MAFKSTGFNKTLVVVTKSKYSESDLAQMKRDAEEHYEVPGRLGIRVVSAECGTDLWGLFLRGEPKLGTVE